MPRHRVAIFVNGCFWHRHRGCKYTTTPKTRPEFWHAKFEANVERDRRKMEQLEEAGWRVITVWECSLKERAGIVIESLASMIRDGECGDVEG